MTIERSFADAAPCVRGDTGPPEKAETALSCKIAGGLHSTISTCSVDGITIRWATPSEQQENHWEGQHE